MGHDTHKNPVIWEPLNEEQIEQLKRGVFLMNKNIACLANINQSLYIIYQDGNTIFAKNGITGNIDYSGTDISAILNSVNSVISDGGTICMWNAIYTPSSQVIFTKSVKLIGEGKDAVIFNWNIKSQFLFTFSGSDLITPNITGNVAAGSNTISVSSVGTAQPGDLVLIKDNTVFNPTDFPNITNGELHEIASISGNTITLTDTTIESFTVSASGFVRLIRPITVEISNIKIVGGNSNDIYDGINLYYTKNSIVNNNTIKDNGEIGIQISNSYNTTIKNNVISDNILDGMGYGIEVLDASSYTTIINNYFSNCRHCISQGGGSGASGGIPRETTIISNVFSDSIGTQDVIDSHAVSESIYIYNNTINSPSGYYAIGSGAKTTKIIGNTIIGGQGTRISGHIPSPIMYEVSDNAFIDSKFCFMYIGTLNLPNNIKITNNIIRGTNINGIVNLYNATLFTIYGNQFDAISTSTSGNHAIYLNTCSNGIISNNIIHNAYDSGILVETLKNTIISANSIINDIGTNSSSTEYGIRIDTGSTYNTISGNIIKKTAYGLSELNLSNNNTIIDNDLSQVGTAGYVIYTVGASTVTRNNTGTSPFNFGNKSSAPSAYGAGDTYFDTTLLKIRYSTAPGTSNWITI